MNAPRSLTAPLARRAAGVVSVIAVLGAASLARLQPATPAEDSTHTATGPGRSVRAATPDEIARAAAAFLRALPDEFRPRATLPFESPERTKWHFIPGDRSGVPMKEMPDASRAAARALVRSALSSRGMLKVEAIMALDNVLRDMERVAGGDGSTRDPLGYYLGVYGTPGAGPWAWRIEGHHVSLHFTFIPGRSVAVTPLFLGANPATVPSGPQAGMRVLSVEEDLGRGLLASLTASQREEAIIGKDAPADILSVPGRSLDEVSSTGVAYSDLDASQQEIVRDLVREYAGTLRGELAHSEILRIADAGWDAIRFAWAGGEHPGERHYYRLSGPTFLIEYDNTQNDANHIHTVWHDRQRDFGRDLLREHLEQDHRERTQEINDAARPER